VRVRTLAGAAIVRAEPAVARRYARALLDVARSQGAAVPHALRDELGGFARLLETDEDLGRALLHPTIATEARRRVVAAVAAGAGASPLLQRLLDVLAGHDRLELLPALAEAYTEALNAVEGRVSAQAVTAVPLAEPQRAALASALCGALGKAVELTSSVDPGVIGGVLVRVGGRTYDGTVRSRLHALRERLASGR
jgi:F-type H+-transporting ATPase subunit delta